MSTMIAGMLAAKADGDQNGEVTLAESGLCPRPIGTKPDPRMTAKARQSGFWEPWLE